LHLSVVALALIVAMGCAATASAAWSSAFDVSAPEKLGAFLPNVGVGAGGGAVFTWGHHSPVAAPDVTQARTRSASGVLGPIVDVAPAVSTPARVAVAANGTAVFLWRSRLHRMRARMLSAAGTLGPVVDVSAAARRAHDGQVAVDPAGNAFFVWLERGGRVRTRSLSTAGELGPIATLSAGGHAVHPPQVAVSAGGDAVFAWDRYTSRTGRVQARARSAAGRLGPTLTLSARRRRAVLPRLAVATDGHALAVWTSPPAGRNDGLGRVQARAFSHERRLGPLLDVSGNAMGGAPRATFLADGDAVLTWYRPGRPTAPLLMRTLSAAARLRNTVTLLGGRDIGLSRVAFAPDGDAVVAWQLLGDGDPEGQNARIQARSRSASGVVGPTVTLAPPGGQVYDPQVAVAANGSAIVTWARFAGGVVSVQAAVGP
jgi:hypothetical protein